MRFSENSRKNGFLLAQDIFKVDPLTITLGRIRDYLRVIRRVLPLQFRSVSKMVYS